MFEPTLLAPQDFRLLLIPPRNSSTVHDAPWDFIRYPHFLLTHKLLHWHPTRINQTMSSMTKGVAKCVKLDDQFNYFQ
jgi:hypothetical protein